jgi:kynurenine formamidase
MDKALGDKKPAIAIDQVPLEWCFQPGVKLDFRHLADGYVVTAADVEAELARIGHTLQPLEIVVVNTRAGSRYGQPTTWPAAAAWATRPPCTCWSAACA